MMDEGWELGGAAHHGASFLDLPHDPVSHEPEAAGWDYSMYSDAAGTARLYPSVSVPSPSPALVMEHSFQPSSRAMAPPSSTTTATTTSAATPATVAAATPTARRSQTTRRAGRRKNSAATSVASSSASPTPSSASSATTATKAGAPARRGRKRARAAGAPKSARRLTHNQSEQRRVKRINEQVEQLRALLKRANLSTRSDKCSVLSSAVQYVKSLEERLAASTERAERFEKALLNARLEAAAPALEPLPSHHTALGHGGAAGAGVGATMTTHGHSMTHHIQHQQQMVLSQNHHHHHAAPSPRLPLGPAPRGAGPAGAAPLSFDYRTVFQYSSIAQAIATTEGDLVDANRLFCELAGLKTRQEVLQYSMFGLTHPSELPVLYGVIGQLLSNTSVNTLQFKKKCVLPIGVLDVVVRMSVVRDTTGKAKCFHCCILPNLDTVLPLADAKACSLPNAAASGYVAPTPPSPAASIASRSTTPATATAAAAQGPVRASPAVMAATAGAVAPAPPLSMPTADMPGRELRVPLAGTAASQTYRQTGALASAMAQPPAAAAAAHPFHAAGQDVVMLANPTHTANVANGANDPALPPTDAEVSQLLGAAAAAIVSPATSTATPSETEVGDADMDEVSSLLSDESPTASSHTGAKKAAAANPACTDMPGTTTTAATAASFGGVKAA